MINEESGGPIPGWGGTERRTGSRRSEGGFVGKEQRNRADHRESQQCASCGQSFHLAMAGVLTCQACTTGDILRMGNSVGPGGH